MLCFQIVFGEEEILLSPANMPAGAEEPQVSNQWKPDFSFNQNLPDHTSFKLDEKTYTMFFFHPEPGAHFRTQDIICKYGFEPLNYGDFKDTMKIGSPFFTEKYEYFPYVANNVNNNRVLYIACKIINKPIELPIIYNYCIPSTSSYRKSSGGCANYQPGVNPISSMISSLKQELLTCDEEGIAYYLSLKDNFDSRDEEKVMKIVKDCKRFKRIPGIMQLLNFIGRYK